MPSPEEAQELVVLIRPGPVIYFPGPDGTIIGFDADCCGSSPPSRAAAPLRGRRHPAADVEPMAAARRTSAPADCLAPRESPAQPRARTQARADPGRRDPAGDSAARCCGAPATARSNCTLIYNRDGYKPAGWQRLDGETVAYVDGAGSPPRSPPCAPRIRASHFRALELPSPAGLIAQVSDGTIDYAIVGSLAAAAARNVYSITRSHFPLGSSASSHGRSRRSFRALRDDLDRFLARDAARRHASSGSPSATCRTRGQFQRIDAGAFQESIRTELPQWTPLFHDAQEKTGIEWRLLAAIAYQESKWDPDATSETGVRGLMQITEDTARHLGVGDRLDPRQTCSARRAICATSRPSCRRASPSPTAPGSRWPRSTSASGISRTPGCWRRSRSSIRTTGAT